MKIDLRLLDIKDDELEVFQRILARSIIKDKLIAGKIRGVLNDKREIDSSITNITVQLENNLITCFMCARKYNLDIKTLLVVYYLVFGVQLKDMDIRARKMLSKSDVIFIEELMNKR